MDSAIARNETFGAYYVYWKKSFHGSIFEGVSPRCDPTLPFQPETETVVIPGEFM